MGRPPKNIELPACLRLIHVSYRRILTVLATTDEPVGSVTRDALAAMAASMLRMLIETGYEPPRRRGRPPRTRP